MAPYNGVDKLVKLIEVMLVDIQMSHSKTFSVRALRLTQQKLRLRCTREGIGFLTKTLPRLGKAFDKALTGKSPLDASQCGFSSAPGCQFPRFLGELFKNVLTSDGWVLSQPCVTSIQHLRDILYAMYKLDIPCASDLNQKVISQFIETENDILKYDHKFNAAASASYIDYIDADGASLVASNPDAIRSDKEYLAVLAWFQKPDYCNQISLTQISIVRNARRLLHRVLSHFDPTDIVPRHGPGAVSTGEQLWDKYTWTTVPDRLTEKYPLDAYFYASLGHFCDEYKNIPQMQSKDHSARVILVPKDSRGPRLISCEPLFNQWIQQGLARAIVHHVEHDDLARFNVHFTDQRPNQLGALQGSRRGEYATLDLKEASDRVSLGLVRLLFPPHICEYMEACRSQSTELPNGQHINLHKFAPMGSALCFPVLALTIWSLLTAAAPDADTRECILVYGDDVIVKTAYAADAIETLESFGLLCNQDKCCTSGLFRESCGVDAFAGVIVTPLRLRKGVPHRGTPGLYPSCIAFANALYDRGYHNAYDLFRSWLHASYGSIPDDAMGLTAPSLREVEHRNKPKRWRINKNLQKREWLVRDVRPRKLRKDLPGWKQLLRYFTEGSAAIPDYLCRFDQEELTRDSNIPSVHTTSRMASSFCSSEYTKRKSIQLTYCWR